MEPLQLGFLMSLAFGAYVGVVVAFAASIITTFACKKITAFPAALAMIVNAAGFALIVTLTYEYSVAVDSLTCAIGAALGAIGGLSQMYFIWQGSKGDLEEVAELMHQAQTGN